MNKYKLQAPKQYRVFTEQDFAYIDSLLAVDIDGQLTRKDYNDLLSAIYHAIDDINQAITDLYVKHKNDMCVKGITRHDNAVEKLTARKDEIKQILNYDF